MVRGMPLKPMHLRPTSRISSAVSTACCWSLEEVTRSKSSFMEAGEFMVMEVAVAMVSQHGVATFLEAESWAMRSNSERMPFGAGAGPGRAKPALMRALSGSDSFAMAPMGGWCGLR